MQRILDPEKGKAILAGLAIQLEEARVKEGIARTERIAIEEKIAKMVPVELGKQRTEQGVTVKRGLIYRITDLEGLKRAWDSMRWKDRLRPIPIKKAKEELDVPRYEGYRKHDSEAFKVLSEHVEVKPAKVSVTLKEEKDG